MREMNESKQQRASLRRGRFRCGFNNRKNLKKHGTPKKNNQNSVGLIGMVTKKTEQETLKEQGRLISEYLASF